MMEVILLERVEKLGQMGQVVKVRPGFARNFLLPQKKALRANKANMAIFEQRRSQLEAANLERRGEAEQVSAKMVGVKVVIIRQAGESGQLYGSVSARDIATGVTEAGFTVIRGQVTLDKAIKTLGLHPVRVVLHPEVAVQVTVNVAQSAEEAEMQAKGINPIQLAQKMAQGGGEDEMPAAPAAKAEKKPAKVKKKADQDEGEAEAKTKTKAEAKPAAKDSGKPAKPKSEKHEKREKKAKPA
jgi:large subunit ribosomal protein L9